MLKRLVFSMAVHRYPCELLKVDLVDLLVFMRVLNFFEWLDCGWSIYLNYYTKPHGHLIIARLGMVVAINFNCASFVYGVFLLLLQVS